MLKHAHISTNPFFGGGIDDVYKHHSSNSKTMYIMQLHMQPIVDVPTTKVEHHISASNPIIPMHLRRHGSTTLSINMMLNLTLR